MNAAYDHRFDMARTLETLAPGTPVFAGDARVGTVSAVYAEGESRAAEIVAVDWDGETLPVGVPAGAVESIDEAGVHLMSTDATQRCDYPPLDAGRLPTLRRIA